MQRRHLAIFAALALAGCVSAAAAQDLRPADIVARHLDSIAKPETRSAIKNMLAAGRSNFTIKVPEGKLIGKSIVVSQGRDFYFVSSFNSKEYPFEKIGLFGGKPQVEFITPGVRSPLGSFLLDNSVALSDSVFGGAISSGWRLASPDLEISRFSSAGKKKINGRDAYVLS